MSLKHLNQTMTDLARNESNNSEFRDTVAARPLQPITYSLFQPDYTPIRQIDGKIQAQLLNFYKTRTFHPTRGQLRPRASFGDTLHRDFYTFQQKMLSLQGTNNKHLWDLKLHYHCQAMGKPLVMHKLQSTSKMTNVPVTVMPVTSSLCARCSCKTCKLQERHACTVHKFYYLVI